MNTDPVTPRSTQYDQAKDSTDSGASAQRRMMETMSSFIADASDRVFEGGERFGKPGGGGAGGPTFGAPYFPVPTPQLPNFDEILNHLPPVPTSPTHQRDLRTIGQWGRDLAHRLANLVNEGRMTVGQASAQLMDGIYKRLGLPSNTQETIALMKKELGTLGTTVADKFKGMTSETFDQLWKAQNIPSARNLPESGPGFRGDANLALITQLRIAGKLPNFVEGLDLTGNVRVGLPLATANTTAAGVAGKNDSIRLNITGEWGLGSSNSEVGLTGGREVNFAITVFKDGTVRLDAVTVNEIVDVSVAKAAAKVMGMFENMVGAEEAIATVEAGGGDLFPDYSTETTVDGEPFYNAEDTLWYDALSAVGSIGDIAGVAGGANIFSRAPIKVGEAAFSTTWVNEDLGNPNAKPRGGWHHDGVLPDSMGVAVKYFSGQKAQFGPNEANLQARFFGMASAGFGYAFTDAGAKTFGRAIGEWGA